MCGIVLQAIFYFTNIAQVGIIVIMIVCITLSLARQYAAKEKSEREAQLRSTRLENELLRKNINPHFILNTITSIIVWLRRDSASAIKLMEALAEEFRLITQISALKLIPIQQEIELCLTHLKIMNYRKGAEFKLITLDINDNENVPPMIFHTLVENGLTHGYENINKGVFSIQRQQLLNGVKYIVSNDGKPSASVKRVSTGLGLKYIEARLEESFSNKWKLTSFGLEDSWQVEIEIYNLSN
jgi:LytS/YehU family sensor histidine kinase